MSANFERQLPEGYHELKTVDAASKKMTVWLNAAAIAVMIVSLAACFLVLRPDIDQLFSGTEHFYLRLFLFLLGMFAYIILHELTHGLAYKLLTGEKLTFGFQTTVAYCGVPDIYVYRKASMISLLAPFTLFTAAYIAAALLSADMLGKALCCFLLSIHLSGCVGDLYDTFLYMFRFRNPDTLMRDTGPKQTFYGK